MHFFKSLLVGATALLSAVSAQSTTLTFTRAVDTAQPGQSVLLEYIAPSLNQPVTMLLRKGPTSNLTTISTITTSATGGTYEWTVPNVPSGDNYALQIEQGDQVNYFGPLAITGGSMTGYLPNPMPATATRTLNSIPSGGVPPVVAGGSSTPANTSSGPSRPRPTGMSGSGGQSGQGGQGGQGGSQEGSSGQGGNSGQGSAITSANSPQNTGAASVNKGHAGLVLGLVGAFAVFA